MSRSNTVKQRYIKEKNINSCEQCGIHSWNDLKLTLQLDHIDGNHKNNEINNLRLLCPNCHSQTKTFCRNKNKIYDIDSLVKNIIESKNIHEVLLKEGRNQSGASYNLIKQTMKNKGLSFFKEEKQVKKFYCKECNERIWWETKTGLCRKCLGFKKRKVRRPLINTLVEEIKNSSYEEVSRKYGVSSAAIRKWLK